jgi:phosphoglycerol transferase MdoB-like AlkP superfamily enzyme
MFLEQEIWADSQGIWGVNDESLFEKVLAKVDDQKNSLNIILTTSFHSPYEIDVFSKGFPYSSKEELPDKIKKFTMRAI